MVHHPAASAVSRRPRRSILVAALALLVVGLAALVARALREPPGGMPSCQPPDAPQTAVLTRGAAQPAPIIFDTDFAPDVDDVGALAILHALADRGEATILGVLISSGNTYAARAADTVNTYYGRPDIPIGITWQPTVAADSPYTLALALDFPNDVQPGLTAVAPNAVTVYRQLLAAQPDASVTIVSVGFLTNLRDLLDSPPDDISALSGLELAAAKVARLVIMGGHYPDSSLLPDGDEYNFAMDAPATYAVVTRWPTPMIFSGFELGVDIETGAALYEQTPPDNPVRVAYQLYTGGTARSSWDLTAVDYAVRGEGYNLCGGGYNEVAPNGHNQWNRSAVKPQAYLTAAVPKTQLEAHLNALLIQPPAVSSTLP